MKLDLVCPHCGAEMSGDLSPGELVQCPACGRTFAAPPPPVALVKPPRKRRGCLRAILVLLAVFILGPILLATCAKERPAPPSPPARPASRPRPSATTTTRAPALTPPPATRPAKPVASSAWKVTRRTDPVTDARFVTARTTGAMISVGGIMRRPEFALRRGPDGLEALFSLGGEGANFPRAGSVVTLRLDDAPAEETAWGPSEDRSVLFYHGDVDELARRLRSASRLIVRASTTLGHTATATFDLAGLRAAWDEFQR